MAPLPKRRWSTRRQGKKRASFALKFPDVTNCPNCGKGKLSHQVCPACGFYKGKEVLKIKKPKSKKAEK